MISIISTVRTGLVVFLSLLPVQKQIMDSFYGAIKDINHQKKKIFLVFFNSEKHGTKYLSS